MNFLYDQPVIFRMAGLGDPEVEVGYLPFESYTSRCICVHSNMEIPLESFRLAVDFRPRFSDFYSRGDFPFRWGVGTFNSRVEQETTKIMDDHIRSLALFPLDAYRRSFLPNVEMALSWPLGYPSTNFIQLAGCPGHCTSTGWKSLAGTALFRMNPQASRYDQVFVEAHKSILKEADIRGVSYDFLPGYDLIKEVAIMQLVRLVSSVDVDLVYSRVPTRLTDRLMQIKNSLENENPSILGNGFWIPSPNTWFDGLYCETTSSFESDDD
ncbi:NSs [Frijoles virus]|uniref:NSs n=2 Tax=Phlebovirus TaxID=11584 RepID=A0A4P8D7T2_9VIRU|nr:nonstructural protein [Phlebovirus sp. VP-161A]QCI62744.1 NSs [Frijoles virus]